jgi:hypothetical protein
MALRTPNLHPGVLKKRLWWSRWRDVKMCRRAMQTHFLNPGHRKKRFERSRFSEFFSMRMALTIIICFLNVLKNDLGAVDKLKFQVTKAMLTHLLHPAHRKKRIERIRLSDDLSRRTALRTHKLSSRRHKKRLWWIRWSDVSRCQRPCDLIFCILGIEKSDLDEVA